MGLHARESAAFVAARERHVEIEALLGREEAILRELAGHLRLLRSSRALALLGLARFDAYVFEHLGLSIRSGEALVQLDRVLEEFPELEESLARGILCRSKILWLARVVVPETVGAWARWAAAHTVRELAHTVSGSRRGDGPPGALARTNPMGVDGTAGARPGFEGAAAFPGSSGGPCDTPEPDGAWVHVCAPAAVAHLFDHALEITRRVIGEEQSPTACVGWILAEYAASHAEPESAVAREFRRTSSEVSPRYAAPDRAEADQEPAPGAGGTSADRSSPAERGRTVRRRNRRLSPIEAHGEVQRLSRERQARVRHLADLLADTKVRGYARLLGYRSFDDYCREGLDVSPRYVRQLLWARRRFVTLPNVARAFDEGKLNWTKTRLLLSIAVPATEAAWLRRAGEVTTRYLERDVIVSRLRDEEHRDGAPHGPTPISHLPPGAAASPIRPGVGLDPNAEKEEQPAEGPGAPAAPGDAHRPWHESAVGGGSAALPCVIRVWLPVETHRLYEAVGTDLRRRFTERLAPWEILFIMLQHFLTTWERVEREAYAFEHRTLSRDGYQCVVPGCRARRSLEVHHVVFRSQGGCDRPWNRVTLCAQHHRVVLHDVGGVACRGHALEGLHWRVGRDLFHGDVVCGVA